MEYKKIKNLLGGLVDPEKLPKYTTIKWIKFMTNLMEPITTTKMLHSKHQS